MTLEHFRFVDRFCSDPSCARYYRRAEPDAAAVLARYSTPGMRRGDFTRDEKRNHLASVGIRGADAERVLERIYGNGRK